MVRTGRIELPSIAWEAIILPLNYVRVPQIQYCSKSALPQRTRGADAPVEGYTNAFDPLNYVRVESFLCFTSLSKTIL